VVVGAGSGRTLTAAVPSALVQRFVVQPERSVVTIEARSSVGPIQWEASGAEGWVDAEISGDVIDTSVPPKARLELPVRKLQSGNTLYDAELMRRIDARRFPTTVVVLTQAANVENRYQLAGDVTFHGVTRPVRGSVSASVEPSGELRVTGEQTFDIRDFRIPSPTILMLKIFPDVRVRLRLEAVREDG
jgi:polyisoprenoid-binding protein YceI